MKSSQDETPQARLSVRLTPRASSDAACCARVADLLGLRPAQVPVSHGHKSRGKVLAITGLSEETLRERLTGRSPG